MFVWAGKIVTEALHASPMQGSLAGVVFLGVALGAGRLGAVVWLRWLGNLRAIWLSVCLVGAGILIALAAHSVPTMTLAMAVIGFGLSAVFPTVLGIAGECLPREPGRHLEPSLPWL